MRRKIHYLRGRTAGHLIHLDLGVERRSADTETDPLIRRALVESIEPLSGYPLAEGLPELREAVAGWCRLRFGVEVDATPGELAPHVGEPLVAYERILHARRTP